MIGAKPLCIRFNKIGGFIKVYDRTRYLSLFGPEKDYSIYNRTRYLIEVENCIISAFSHYYAKIKVDSYDPLPIGKTLILNNVIILIKSVLNKDQNHNRLSEKYLYQLTKN